MSEPSNHPPNRFKFVPEITLGNMLQLLSIAAAVIGLWMNMDRRISAVELRETFAVEERRDLKKSLATLADNQALLTRTVDRVSIIIETKQKGEVK
jgi:hypothetical protein